MRKCILTTVSRTLAVLPALAFLAISCNETHRNSSSDMMDAWLKQEGIKTSSAFQATVGRITRRGIPISLRQPECVHIKVPQEAVLLFHAAVTSREARTSTEGIDFLVTISRAALTEPREVLLSLPLQRLSIEKPRWETRRVDLDDYGLQESMLCFSLVDHGTLSPEKPANPSLKLWVGNPQIRRKDFRAVPADRPNLIVITLDTTRDDHISAAGYPLPTTPRLDQLAEDGELFTNAVANSSWTLPTHASLFTGLYPSEHGADMNPAGKFSIVFKFSGLSQSAITLAEELSERRYQTAGIAAGPMVSAEFGFAQGFHYYNDQVPLAPKPRRAEEVTDLALAWLAETHTPFFLFLNYFDPHWPYEPPADLLRVWVPADVRPISSQEQRKIWQDVMRDQRPISEQEKRSMISNYDGEIAAMDRAIGRLIDGLKERGLYNSTLIVVVGDHGESFGEHYMIDHGQSLYEDVLHIPLIIKYPNAARYWRRGRTITDRVDHLDVYASIGRELGLTLPRRLDSYGVHEARSLHFAVLKRNPWFVAAYGPRFDRALQAVYQGPWKLLRDDKGNHWLFDVHHDPLEQVNVAETDTLKTRELESILDAWQVSVRSSRLPVSTQNLSPERLEQLRALGYVGGR